MDLGWLESLLTTSADAYVKVKSGDALVHQQRANDGTFYTMGQFQDGSQSSGIMPMMLLIGGAALLFVLVKD